MKKPVALLTAACLAMLAAGPLVLNSSADDLGFMLRTTPENPYNWTTDFVACEGAITSSVEYAGGPHVPNAQGDGDITPHGGGSLAMHVGSNGASNARVRNPYLDGASVAGIDLDYSWIASDRPNAPTDSGSQAPWLRLSVAGPQGPDVLIYEPYFNRSDPNDQRIPVGIWGRDDAGVGRWWRNSDPPNNLGTNLFTLAEYASVLNPGATVATDVPKGALAISAGCGAPASEWTDFEGAIDDVTLKRDAQNPPTTFDFEPTILTVFPGAPQGWTFTTTAAAGSTTPPSVALVQGPGDPFFGTGSVQFAVGSHGDSRAEARSPDLDGRAVGDIEALGYGTYVQSRADEAGCREAPYLRLDVDRVAIPGASPTLQTLYFHPCENYPNGAVPALTWQRWDAARGNWQWQEANPVAREAARMADAACNETTQTCRGTLAEYAATYDGSPTVADTAAGGLAIGAGGGNSSNPNNTGATTNTSGTRWAGFVGNADFLTRDHSAIPGRDYDFEGQPPPPPATTTTTGLGGGGSGGGGDTGGAPTTSTTVRRTTTTTRGSGTTTTTNPSTTTTTDPDGGSSAQVSRRQGADRLATAIDISQSDFDDDEAGAVVLARAENYPDALAATPLAGDRRGPLLLTFPDSLDSRVEDEIRRVLPSGGTVHLAGGSAAIGPNVENRLREGGFNVVRHSGRNRFETAQLLAEQVPTPAIAFLATGLNFPDALPAGAAAIAERGVVLLTADTQMPPETTAYLNARPGLRRFAVGGQAAAADPGSERAVGVDRFETAVAVARRFFPEAVTAGVASGTNFPDALAGGAHIGSRNGPLLLTPHEPLPGAVRQWLADHRSTLRNVFIYGGPNAITTNTENEIRTAVS